MNASVSNETVGSTNNSDRPHFAGRRRALARLGLLLVRYRFKMVSLRGDPGIGKTRLIRQFAKDNAHAFSGGVHWFSAAHAVSAKELASLRAVAGALYVFDDLDRVPRPEQAAMLRVVDALPADSCAVLISRDEMPFMPDAEIVLNSLTAVEMLDLLQLGRRDVGKEDLRSLAKVTGGNPLLVEFIGRLLTDKRLTLTDLTLFRGFRQPGLVDQFGRPLLRESGQGKVLIAGVASANSGLLRHLEKHPADLHRLTPREFEELVAEVLSRQGYEVRLTPFSKDGGHDLFVASKKGLGDAMYIVECKRYSPTNPVGVQVVRQLYGVVQAHKLTGGVVATTSRFTKGAQEFTANVKYQLSLADYLEVHTWIRTAIRQPDP